MHEFIKGAGFLAVAGGIIAAVSIYVIGGSRGNEGAAVLTALWIGLPLIMSGAVLYCFGAIVEHLIAIRKATERQVEIFDRLGQPKA